MINGKEYIGKHQTKVVEDGYLGSGKYLSRAIKKYGVENFKREILFTFDVESDMNSKEAELVTEEYCSHKNTYNICPGGKGGFGYVNNSGLGGQVLGYQAAKETWTIKYGPDFAKVFSKKANEVNKLNKTGIYAAEAHRFQPGNNNWLGKKHNEETKKKIGLANSTKIGSLNSQYGTCWITNGKENKKIKKETISEWESQGYRKGRINF